MDIQFTTSCISAGFQSSSTQMDYITVRKVIQTPCLLLKLDIQFTLTEMINLPTQNTNVKKTIFSPSHITTNNIFTYTLSLTVSITL